eukprot:COSAG04_NODE_8059_length_1028_cov_1.871905_1_plen_50_part_01
MYDSNPAGQRVAQAARVVEEQEEPEEQPNDERGIASSTATQPPQPDGDGW